MGCGITYSSRVNYITWYYKNIIRRNSWECITLKITLNWSIQVAAQTIAHTSVDIPSLQRVWLVIIHTKILLTALVVLTSSCMLGLAPAARRSSTTLWWPPKLAVHSGVRPFYSQCVSVYCRKGQVYSFLSDVSQHMPNMKNEYKY